MKSHDYAQRLKEIGEFLLTRPEFETNTAPMLFFHMYKKEHLLAAVRSLGSGTKELTNGSYAEIKFKPTAAPEIIVSAARDTVCVKVQEAKWECEPLLSQAEEAELVTK